ncbi:MAG: zinc-binding dehydrogenase [Acidobacteria bacterium]|uniref:Zinc-binding dehydrogenase n=1 Tax=Candidatus Polarisedimenticola svalbardensis TaxID=2886004 RepID=A0A8J6Y1B5_9BACT|nr:zinc-binding dehydrogenase [Candidatus Polarisedimenticola svalbardensis]
MKTVVVREHGGVDRLLMEDHPVPLPGPGELRIAVRGVGLNHLDVWVRRGVKGHVFPLPIIPGCDISGTVDLAGAGTSRFRAGDEVVVAPGFSCGHCHQCRSGRDALCRQYGIRGESCDGGCAEYVVIPETSLFPKPATLSFEEAAAMPLVFLTAWHMLVERARLKAGEKVLIHAAASGVSSAAIQIARLLGARVLATAGSAEKCRLATELGAEEAVNYREADFRSEVKRWTGKAGVEVALDHIGSETFGPTLACLAKGGRYVTCGSTSGFEMKTDFRIVFFKSLSILGSTMGSDHELETVLGLAAEGRLRPVLEQALPLEKVGEAHQHLESRKAMGKTVLVP